MSMMMGFGCNAAGVVATRIIDSPRERLIAIITNNFSLCNGRWPTQILLATIFVGAWAPSYLTGIVAASAVVTVALLGIFLAFLFSWALSRTVLRGQVSTFSLELPPYRPPRLGLTLYTSLIDRTLFVLWRAIVFAAPAGAVIWLVANVQMGNQSLAEHIIHWLNPVGAFFGLNGVILLAYLIAIPANEIVVPTILMLTALTVRMSGVGDGAGVIFEAESDAATLAILKQGGWTLLTAMNVMLFSLMHNPCSTTIYTIYKESGSLKWTVVATVLPIILGLLTTFAVTTLWRHFS
jgi:ferrous iron transport protein B